MSAPQKQAYSFFSSSNGVQAVIGWERVGVRHRFRYNKFKVSDPIVNATLSDEADRLLTVDVLVPWEDGEEELVTLPRFNIVVSDVKSEGFDVSVVEVSSDTKKKPKYEEVFKDLFVNVIGVEGKVEW